MRNSQVLRVFLIIPVFKIISCQLFTLLIQQWYCRSNSDLSHNVCSKVHVLFSLAELLIDCLSISCTVHHFRWSLQLHLKFSLCSTVLLPEWFWCLIPFSGSKAWLIDVLQWLIIASKALIYYAFNNRWRAADKFHNYCRALTQLVTKLG